MGGYVAGDVVETPWGRTDELRARRLRPGPGAQRELVLRNQRERIFAAMLSCSATKGYPATTVSDLIALAGVSRATFYEHFEDKADCFRAMVTVLLKDGMNRIVDNFQGDGDPEERSKDALRTALCLAVEQPAAARVCLVEAYSAGPTGLDLINQALEEACRLAHASLQALPGRGRVPERLSRSVIGGLHRVLYLHLYRGEADTLPDRCEELWRWAVGFAPPYDLPKPRRRRTEPEPDPAKSRDPHERILRGFARAVSVGGYARVTIPQIAAAAGISNATFYKHFENKHDAFLAALDLSGAQLAAASLPAARREDDWPQAIRRAIEGLCLYLTSEPAFARLRTVEVFSAGPEAIEHRDRAWEAILHELVPADLRQAPEPGPLALTAGSGACYSLIHEKVRRGELGAVLELPPLLTYVTLTPFLGAEAAANVAAGRRTRPLPA